MKDPEVSGASCPLCISGKEYKAKPFTDRQFDEINNWLRYVFIRDIKSASVNFTDAERQEILGEAIKSAVNINWLTPEGNQLMLRTESYARLAYIMVGEPGSFERFVEEFAKNKVENIEETDRVFFSINGFEESKGNGKAKKKSKTQ